MAVFKDGKGNVAVNKLEARDRVYSHVGIGAPEIKGGIALSPEYTVALLPDALAAKGRLVYCSDGDAGSPCLAYSDGTNWLRIVLGAAVATS